MRNNNPTPRRCYLPMYWNTSDAQVEAHYSHAHLVMDALVGGGWTEAQAKKAVERIWNSGRSEGYDEGCYDSSDY